MRRDLVEAARRGDHEAFEVLATSAGDRLYAVARPILRASDLAEDAVQEALVRAWQQTPMSSLGTLTIRSVAADTSGYRLTSHINAQTDSGAVRISVEAVTCAMWLLPSGSFPLPTPRRHPTMPSPLRSRVGRRWPRPCGRRALGADPTADPPSELAAGDRRRRR